MDDRTREFIRLLAAAGWSQAEAARKLQITAGAVSQICNGKIRPSASTLNLMRLMAARGRSSTPAAAGKGAPKLEPWAQDLISDLERLSPAERDFVLKFIRQTIRNLPALTRTRPKS